jgi:hypothetical protein
VTGQDGDRRGGKKGKRIVKEVWNGDTTVEWRTRAPVSACRYEMRRNTQERAELALCGRAHSTSLALTFVVRLYNFLGEDRRINRCWVRGSGEEDFRQDVRGGIIRAYRRCERQKSRVVMPDILWRTGAPV